MADPHFRIAIDDPSFRHQFFIRFRAWWSIQEVKVDIGEIMFQCKVKNPFKFFRAVVIESDNKTCIDMDSGSMYLLNRFLVDGASPVMVLLGLIKASGFSDSNPTRILKQPASPSVAAVPHQQPHQGCTYSPGYPQRNDGFHQFPGITFIYGQIVIYKKKYLVGEALISSITLSISRYPFSGRNSWKPGRNRS